MKSNYKNKIDHLSKSPDEIMKLKNLGSYHPTRLSFSRQLINEMCKKNWSFNIFEWKINKEGKGHSILTVNTKENLYSFVIFSHLISNEERSDRVIADKWDLTFTLFKGMPNKNEFKHLKRNVPLQEKGIHIKKQITLSRANKSMRLYSHTLENLSKGKQPDFNLVKDIGYLLRTTAVYGNGKFGIDDFKIDSNCKVLSNPFWSEMLTVYMLKYFSIELINFIAKQKNNKNSVKLNDEISQYIGTGNATGLGMAPYIVNHPKLIHTWINNKQNLLSKIYNKKSCTQTQINFIYSTLKQAYEHVCQWNVEDNIQRKKIIKTRKELLAIIKNKKILFLLKKDYPFKKFMYFNHEVSMETKEILHSILIETFPSLADKASEKMSCTEEIALINNYNILKLKKIISNNYSWALKTNLKNKSSSYYFWYVSKTKEEPRLGIKSSDNGYEKRLPLDICLQVNQLSNALNSYPDKMKISEFLINNPAMKYVLKRILLNEKYKFSEIRENLTDKKMKPIDILRFKLSFFGATKFDPKSNLWTRIALFQGAPLPNQLNDNKKTRWFFPILKKYDSKISKSNKI